MGQGGLYYEKAVKPKLHSFMGSVFEQMYRYYTLEQGIQGQSGHGKIQGNKVSVFLFGGIHRLGPR